MEEQEHERTRPVAGACCGIPQHLGCMAALLANCIPFVAYQRPQIPCGRFFMPGPRRAATRERAPHGRHTRTTMRARSSQDAVRRAGGPARRRRGPLHASRHRAGLARLGLDEPEPAGGLRARARRPHHRRRLARKVRAGARRTQRACRLRASRRRWRGGSGSHRRRCRRPRPRPCARSDGLRDARAVLPHRQAAPVHRGAHRRRRCTRGGGQPRPESAGCGQGVGPATRSRHPRGRGRATRRMR